MNIPDDEQLKPCPFCNGTDIREIEDCIMCCDRCQSSAYDEQWQHRPIEDVLHARIAELEYEMTERLAELEHQVYFYRCAAEGL